MRMTLSIDASEPSVHLTLPPQTNMIHAPNHLNEMCETSCIAHALDHQRCYHATGFETAIVTLTQTTKPPIACALPQYGVVLTQHKKIQDSVMTWRQDKYIALGSCHAAVTLMAHAKLEMQYEGLELACAVLKVCQL